MFDFNIAAIIQMASRQIFSETKLSPIAHFLTKHMILFNNLPLHLEGQAVQWVRAANTRATRCIVFYKNTKNKERGKLGENIAMQFVRGDGNLNLNFISSLQPCCRVEQSTWHFPEQLSDRESQVKGKDVSGCGMMAQDRKKKIFC